MNNTITVESSGKTDSLLFKLSLIAQDLKDVLQTLTIYPALVKGVESPDDARKINKINKKLKELENAISSLSPGGEGSSDHEKYNTLDLLLDLNNPTVLSKIQSIVSSEDIDLTGYVRTELLDSFVTEVDANTTYQKKSDFNSTISNYLTETESDSRYATTSQLNDLSSNLSSNIQSEVSSQLALEINTTADLLDTLTAISLLINENTVQEILELLNYKTEVNEQLLDWGEYNNLIDTYANTLVCIKNSTQDPTTHAVHGDPFHTDNSMLYYTNIYNVSPGTTLKIDTLYISGMASKYRVGVFYKFDDNDTLVIVHPSLNDPFTVGYTETGSFEVIVPQDATHFAVCRHNTKSPGVYIRNQAIISKLQNLLSSIQELLSSFTVKPNVEVYKFIFTEDNVGYDAYRINHNDGNGNSYTFWFRKVLQKKNMFDYNYVNCEKVDFTELNALRRDVDHLLLANTNTDIIGPVSIGTGSISKWYGGSHKDDNDSSITAKTESYSVKVDGVEVELNELLQGLVCEITIVNKLGDYNTSGNLTNLMLTETRIYTIDKNRMKVRVTHLYANNAVGKTIKVYYGMLANLKEDDKILTFNAKLPYFVLNSERQNFLKSEYPNFLKFVLRSEQEATKNFTTTVWLNPHYGIGNHCYINSTTPIFTKGTQKSYHVLIKDLPITEGLTYSWEGVYTFENDSDLHVSERYSDLTSPWL